MEFKDIEKKFSYSPTSNSETDEESFGRKCPNCGENAGYYLTEFTDNTSIHGLKYIGERGRSIIEKGWWIIVCAIAIYLSIILIQKTHQKWINSPVIVSFATTPTPIWDIPFPAVTICPEVKATRGEYNHTRTFMNMFVNGNASDEEIRNFFTMSLVCEDSMEEDMFNQYDFDHILDEERLDFLLKVAPNSPINQCVWQGHESNCSFRRVLTSEGVCYTFNMLDKSEIFSDEVEYAFNRVKNESISSRWSLESGYPKDAGLFTYPKRTFLAGTRTGLDILLVQNVTNIDYMCGDSLLGYKVILHHPAEIPRVKQQYFRVPVDQGVVAAVKPNMMTTSEDLRSYSAEDRHCYFTEEKKLKFFKTYTQQNCLIECLTNFTFKLCDCVEFHRPRTPTMDMCSSYYKECIKEADAIFLANEVDYKIKHSGKQHSRNPLGAKNVDVIEKCNCLPSCTSLEFHVETSQSTWDWREYLKVFALGIRYKHNSSGAYKEINSVPQEMHMSKLTIFFKDMQFTTSERNELYGYSDFWANVGGLLALFTGISFISLVEIFYFLTLRLLFNIRNYGYTYFSGSDTLLNKKNKRRL